MYGITFVLIHSWLEILKSLQFLFFLFLVGTFLHCEVSPPTLESCSPAVRVRLWVEAVLPCLPFETSAPSPARRKGGNQGIQLIQSNLSFLCGPHGRFKHEQYLSLQCTLVHLQVVSGWTLLHQIWTKLIHLRRWGRGNLSIGSVTAQKASSVFTYVFKSFIWPHLVSVSCDTVVQKLHTGPLFIQLNLQGLNFIL